MPTPNPIARKDHKGGAAQATLTTSMSISDTTFNISTNTGWPTTGVGDFYAVIDPGTSAEEKVLCASQSTNVVTVATAGRGADGTTAKSHSTGAVVYPCWTAAEADELNAHAAATTDIHGITGPLASRDTNQTLTNKTMSGVVNTFSDIPSSAVVGLDTHTASTTAHGASGAVVGTTNTQTLTNKTISGGSNTLSAIPLSAITLAAATANVFTNSGTWNKPAGLLFVRVRLQAAGGPGGGAPATGAGQLSCAGGGGGGGYAESIIPASSLGSSVTVTLGAAGVSASGGGGTDAGNSSFGTHLTANGGGAPSILAAGSTDAWATGGGGGTASVSTGVGFAVQGSAGFFGQRIAGNNARGGAGGGAHLAGATRPSNNLTTTGFAGTDYGGGGSGSSNGASQSASTGPNGGGAICIVENYFA